MASRSIFRSEVVSVRRAAWLGETCVTPPREGWIALGTVLLLAASLIAAALTITGTTYDWVPATVIANAAADAGRSPLKDDMMVATVRSPRPDLIDAYPAVFVRSPNGVGEHAATVASCRLANSGRQPCNRVRDAREVTLTLTTAEAPPRERAMRYKALDIRLPTGERHVLALLTRSGSLR